LTFFLTWKRTRILTLTLTLEFDSNFDFVSYFDFNFHKLFNNALSLLFHRYSNFISSSELVASVQGRTNMCDLLRIMGSDITPTSSPTSGHLTIILNLLTQLLKIVTNFAELTGNGNEISDRFSFNLCVFYSQNLDYECLMLVLKWCGVIFNNAQMYLSSLLITKEFLKLIEQLIYFGGRSTEDFAIDIVLNDLSIFLINPNNWESKVVVFRGGQDETFSNVQLIYCIFLQPNLLQSIAELCFIHFNATSPTISLKCKRILMQLPWSTVICVLRKISRVRSIIRV
jgi:hypothetical protein